MFPPPLSPPPPSSTDEDPLPDPLFMALRTALAGGPIGRVRRWLEARREARWEAAAAVAAANDLVRVPSSVTDLATSDESARDLAA